MAKINLEQIWSDWHAEEKPLGKGSYGTVYKAVRQDNNLTSYSAVKVISIPQDPSEIDTLRSEGLDLNQSKTYLKGVVDDFVREIQLMQSFKGTQNIVSVEDYKVVPKTDEIGWDIYIRMELLTSFNEYVCDKKLSEQDVIKLGIDICTALEMCESRNIIHRDIKPDNIFINDFGYFKLGDFGIARTMANMTNGMSQKGTPFYMAPEVFVSNRYDARVDICSLGIVMYKLLNKDLLPFIESKDQLMNPNAKANALERRKLGEPMIPPCEASPAMANLILRACAHDPDDRFANASEMKAALMSVQNGTYKILSLDPDATTSVRRKSQDLNATTSVRRKEQNFDGTTSVRHAPQNYADNAPNTFGTKKKSKAPAIIAAILAVVLLAGGGFLAYPHIANMLNVEQTGDIGESEDKQNETAKYSKKDNEQIASIISEAEAVVIDDIEGAIAKIQTGLVTYPKSADLQNKLDDYTERLSAQIKADTLDKAAELADSGDYVAAMAMIETARKDSPDDADYKSAYDKYNKLYNEQVKEQAITTADEQAKSSDYVSALNTVNKAMAQVGDDSTLKSLAKTYSDAYAKDVLSRVDQLVSESKYDEAKNLLSEAISVVPENDDVKNKQTEVNKYKTVPLNTLNPINGGFTWNDGVPSDPFGNTYSDAINYVIYHDYHYARSTYAEYKVDKEYTNLTFTISPYSDFGENSQSYVRVYVNDVIRYTSDIIKRNSGQTFISLDISDANTVKIELVKDEHGCIMLSDVKLHNNPTWQSTIKNDYTSLSILKPLNGGFTWNHQHPSDPFGNPYNDAINYVIYHDYHYARSTYAEYKVDKQYTNLTFTISPYSDFGENSQSYVRVYVNDVIRYTSDIIKRNSGQTFISLDISDANTVKIELVKDEHGCIMLSDVKLHNDPTWQSTIKNDYISLSALKPLNGGFTWNHQHPSDPFGTPYNNAINYVIYHDYHYTRSTYAEYYINKQYKDFSLTISPYSDFGENANAVVKIYVDNQLVQTVTVKKTTTPQTIKNINVANADYLKIVIEKDDRGCTMLSDMKLTPAQ